MEIQAGDTVRLKSGGPVMIVESVEAGTALCSWFKGEDRHREPFFVVALGKCDPPTSRVELI